MGEYMFRTNYTQSGLKGRLAEGGAGREAVLRQTIEGAGGSLEGSTTPSATAISI